MVEIQPDSSSLSVQRSSRKCLFLTWGQRRLGDRNGPPVRANRVLLRIRRISANHQGFDLDSLSRWLPRGGEMGPKFIGQVIGGSTPPLAMQKIVNHVRELDPRTEA